MAKSLKAPTAVLTDKSAIFGTSNARTPSKVKSFIGTLSSVTSLGDLLDFGQPFKAFVNN